MLDSINDILIDYDQFLGWHPNFDLSLLRDPRYVYHLSVDLAGGNGRDYTIITIFAILPMNDLEIKQMRVFSDEYSFFKQVQIGIFRCNTIDIPTFAKYSYHLFTEIFLPDNFKVTLENNYEGNYYRQIVTTLYGDANLIDGDYTFVSYPYNMKDEDSTATRVGLLQNEKTKEFGCTILKDQIGQNQTIITEKETVNESLSFAKKPNGKGGYKAMTGHDDCIMTVVNASHFRNTEDFQELCDIIVKFCSANFFKLVNEKLEKISVMDDDNSDISDCF